MVGLYLDFVGSISTADIDNRVFISDVLVTIGTVGMTKLVCFCLCNFVIFEN